MDRPKGYVGGLKHDNSLCDFLGGGEPPNHFRPLTGVNCCKMYTMRL